MRRHASPITDTIPLQEGILYGPVRPGVAKVLVERGWEDKDFIARRVYAMDDIRREVEKWPPKEVENVSGVPEDKVYQIAKTMAENRPGTIVWCMGESVLRRQC